MKKNYLYSLFARYLTLLVLALLSTNLAWGADTYERLTSIDNIDESAQYVLGIDGTGFHYSGTSSWGLTALPSKQTPYYYTLKKAADGQSFTAQTTISNKTYYLQVPTSNTFGMAERTGTNTDLIIGTTQSDAGDDKNFAVANKDTPTRHLRRNGDSGLRSYAGKTGSPAFFYKVVKDEKTLVSLAISGTPKTTYETGESFDRTGLTVTGTYSDASTDDLTNDAEWTIDPATFTSTSQKSVSVTATVGDKSDTKNYSVTVNEHIVTPGTYEISLNNALYGIGTGNNGTEQSKKVNDITVISGCSSSASNKTYYGTDQIRYYTNSYLKLAVPEGYLITKVVFAEPLSSKQWDGSITSTPDTYNADTKTWSGSSQTVDFAFGKQNRAASITVTYIRNKTLDHIGVTGEQKSFFVGDEFKHDGMTVTAYYDDETSEDVTSLATFSTPDMTTAGEKTVTVTYNNKETSYNINVQAVVLTSVEVSGEPTKKEYYVGESFNTAGLVVTGHYNNGTQATITEGITWAVTPETFTETTQTSVAVTAKVGDVTSTEYEVTGLTVTSPESAYTLTAEPAEGGSYTVIVGGDPAVEVTTEAKQFKVTEETIIQVEATAAEHYQVHSTPFEGKYADETPISFEKTGVANKMQFTYGTADATITAKFIRMYAVNIDENIEHGTVVADKSEATPNTGITLTLTPDAHYHFKSVTVKDKNGDNIATDTPETKDNITTTKFQMPSAEAKKGDVSVTATFEEDPKYTVTFSVNGVNTKSEPNYANTPVVFPKVSDVAGYTFIGWTTGPIAKTQDTKPETIIEAVYSANNDKVYYAFFAKKTGSENYVKVTSATELADGKYLIVYETETDGRAFNGKDEANDYVDVTINNGEIADANSAAIVEIAAMTGGYSLKITNGDKADSYIYGKSGSNSIQYDITAVASTISITDGAAMIENNSTYFCYNAASGNDRFRFFKSTTTGNTYIVPALYKKHEATYSNYRTCVTHVPVTINNCRNASFCSEFDLDFTGMDAEGVENKIGAYIGRDYVDGDNAVLNLLGIDKVPAKTGIFVIGTPGTYAVPIYTGGDLKERDDNILIGTTEPYKVKENETIYALGKTDGLLHPVSANVEIGVGKAYYRLPEGADALSVLTLAIIDEPTGITSYENENDNDNKSKAVYNLQGIRVTTPKKGEIYIMNGKKFLMK